MSVEYRNTNTSGIYEHEKNTPPPPPPLPLPERGSIYKIVIKQNSIHEPTPWDGNNNDVRMVHNRTAYQQL